MHYAYNITNWLQSVNGRTATHSRQCFWSVSFQSCIFSRPVMYSATDLCTSRLYYIDTGVDSSTSIHSSSCGCTGWPQQESPAWFLKKLYQNVPIKLWLDLSVIQAHNFKLLLTRNTFCRTRSLSNATFSFFVHVAFIQFKICSCVQNLVWW